MDVYVHRAKYLLLDLKKKNGTLYIALKAKKIQIKNVNTNNASATKLNLL